MRPENRRLASRGLDFFGRFLYSCTPDKDI